MESPVVLQFCPGFRLNALDLTVLILGSIAAVNSWPGRTGFIIAFVVSHFFLFCNVFRIARNLELLWAIGFIVLVASSQFARFPPWPLAIGLTLLLTVLAIGLEMRMPSYHGIAWKWINPQLPQWWADQSRTP